ncbi:MAG: SixA phosphatase family protein [Motilibacteraceae bacterium]
MPTLVLLRHAKSDYPEGVPDHDRPLAERGERDAAAVAKVLSAGPVPELVLCSSAARARATWARVERALEAGGGDGAIVRYEPDVYLASARALLGLARATPAAVGRLLVVGHNPGLQDLALSLAGSGPTPALAALAEKLPTAGLVTLTSDASWDSWTTGCCRLESFEVPRG